MTLSPTLPVTVAELAARLSTMISDVNSLWALYSSDAWVISYMDHQIAAAETSIAANDVPIEVIGLTAEAALNLEEITGGRRGMLKVLVADDSNVTVIHNASKIILKGGEDLQLNAGDVLILCNRDGDPEAVADGYWREILRQLF